MCTRSAPTCRILEPHSCRPAPFTDSSILDRAGGVCNNPFRVFPPDVRFTVTIVRRSLGQCSPSGQYTFVLRPLPGTTVFLTAPSYSSSGRSLRKRVIGPPSSRLFTWTSSMVRQRATPAGSSFLLHLSMPLAQSQENTTFFLTFFWPFPSRSDKTFGTG